MGRKASDMGQVMDTRGRVWTEKVQVRQKDQHTRGETGEGDRSLVGHAWHGAGKKTTG